MTHTVVMNMFPGHHSAPRRPVVIADAVRRRGRITIRPATAADGDALRRLAALSSRPVPDGALTVAETEEGIVAAVGENGRGAIADPFRVTSDLLELLRLRREQLAAA
jgi:hypothetical protein